MYTSALVTVDRSMYSRSEQVLTVLLPQLYCMALFHKDWELPNSRFWMTEIDIDRGLDFPIEKVANSN